LKIAHGIAIRKKGPKLQPVFRITTIEGGFQKMTNDTVEAAKADAKKGIADAGKAGAYVKADAEADVEKAKASFGKSDLEKKVAYATADIKADAKKANAEIENKMAHAKADLEKAKAGQKK